ncbi:MAG: hypothetical protein NT165_04070 [Candidatus Falkowbacteria bacterium]|nr:hypothetical protein [Candidatus Falkowbacteria bacterium]
MGIEEEQISGKLREDRRSSNTIDQSLMNRSSSVSQDGNYASDNDVEEENIPGADYANLREQQNRARVAQAAQESASGGRTKGSSGGTGVASKIGSAIGGSSKNPKALAEKRLKMMIIRALLTPFMSCCFVGCLWMTGILATAGIMIAILADPLKALGLAFDIVWEALKSAVGAIAGFFTGG